VAGDLSLDAKQTALVLIDLQKGIVERQTEIILKSLV